MNVFIKSSKTNKDLVGCVWPGKTYYTDYNHPNATKFWQNGLQNLTNNYGLTPSGIWIDMNEYSNFIYSELLDETKSCESASS